MRVVDLHRLTKKNVKQQNLFGGGDRRERNKLFYYKHDKR